MDAAAAPWASRPKWKFRQALTGKQNRCLIRTLSKNLSALRPDPGLSNNLPLLRRRLDGASSCDRPGAHASYTFVPAAAGAHDGEMAVYGMPEDVLLGGISSTASGRPMGQKMTVPVVNSPGGSPPASRAPTLWSSRWTSRARRRPSDHSRAR
tara:strand:- start:1 stop:459 length:459 start_codon:yes stop_codon:yes gene_type:complete